MKKLLLLCLLSIWPVSPIAAAEPVKIGFIGPLTGAYSDVGIQSRQVLNLLAQDINSRAGLLGQKLEIIFENEEDDAPAAATRLISQKVIAVIGGHTSDKTSAVQDILHAAKVIQISYGASAVSLTEKGLPFFFRTCPRDDEQAKAFVRIIRKLNFKKVAVLHDQSLYGRELARIIDDQLHSWMINTVYQGSLTPGRSDYTEILEKIKATEPDIIFFAGYYPEAARLLQSRLQLGWKIPIVGPDAVNNQQLVEIAGKKAVQGFYFLSPPNPEDLQTPQTKVFLERLQETYGQKPTSIYPLLAGNAFLALTETVLQIQSTDAPQIADYLHRRYFNSSGLTGEIFFNVWGDVVNDLYAVYQVDENGRFILKRRILHGDFIQ